jgi:hypothetical protein
MQFQTAQNPNLLLAIPGQLWRIFVRTPGLDLLSSISPAQLNCAKE